MVLLDSIPLANLFGSERVVDHPETNRFPSAPVEMRCKLECFLALL
jgi:hypothetical protein